MKRNYKIILSLVFIILGWLSLGIGYTTTIYPLQYLFYSGFVFIFVSILLYAEFKSQMQLFD